MSESSGLTAVIDIEAADRAAGVRPETAMRLMQLAGDPTSKAEDVVAVIDADPSMAMRTLKLANSALYGMPHRIARIVRATAMLGIGTIAKLASSCSVETALRNIRVEAPGIEKDTLWRYSLSVALATEVVVAECPPAKTVAMRRLGAESFVTGLIHDIGVLVQAKLSGEQFAAAVQASQKTGLPLISQERKLIGIDHAEIGKRLATHWSLPDNLIEGIACHHEPMAADPEHRSLACVVYAASQLVRRAGVVSYDGDTDTPSLDAALEHLRIDTRRIDKLARAIGERLKAGLY